MTCSVSPMPPGKRRDLTGFDVVSLTRNDATNSCTRVRCVALAAGNQMHMAVHDSLSSCGTTVRTSSHFDSAALLNGSSWGKCDPNREADYVQSSDDANGPSGNRRSG